MNELSSTLYIPAPRDKHVLLYTAERIAGTNFCTLISANLCAIGVSVQAKNTYRNRVVFPPTGSTRRMSVIRKQNCTYMTKRLIRRKSIWDFTVDQGKLEEKKKNMWQDTWK